MQGLSRWRNCKGFVLLKSLEGDAIQLRKEVGMWRILNEIVRGQFRNKVGLRRLGRR